MNNQPGESRQMTRREALAWLAAAGAGVGVGLGLQGKACGEDEAKPKTIPRLTDLVGLRNEAAKAFSEPAVIVVRTTKGLAAFQRVCTHRHSSLDVSDDAGCIVCPRHGSRFDFEGKPTNGPATAPLKWLKVEVDGAGAVRVDARANVSAGEWAKLPTWAQPKDKKGEK